jgi:hypothetical protein
VALVYGFEYRRAVRGGAVMSKTENG